MSDVEMIEHEELARAIGEVEPPRAREAFRAELRAALLDSAEVEWARRREPALRWPAVPRLALAAAAVALVMLAGGTGLATASSLPGDRTYGIKLALERVELALAFDDEARVAVLARQSGRRLEDLQRVADSRPQQAPTASERYRQTFEQMRQAVDTLVQSPVDGRRDAALDLAERAAEKHVIVLEVLVERVPSAENALERAKELKEKAKQGRERRGHDDDDDDDDDDDERGDRRGPSPRGTPRP